LLSFGALGKLTSTFAYVAGAAIAWKQVKPLLEAARQPEAAGCADLVPSVSRARASQSDPLVIAKDITFRFPDRAEPALQDCSFRISHGDRVHLSGPSGSGKSTLVSLLTGLRTPESGLLLLDGLDRATLSAAGCNWAICSTACRAACFSSWVRRAGSSRTGSGAASSWREQSFKAPIWHCSTKASPSSTRRTSATVSQRSRSSQAPWWSSRTPEVRAR
jgi:hypothetical protein